MKDWWQRQKTRYHPGQDRGDSYAKLKLQNAGHHRLRQLLVGSRISDQCFRGALLCLGLETRYAHTVRARV
jgi:hypothetical protein